MEMNCLTWERAGLPSANLLKTDWTTGWADRTSSRKLCCSKWHSTKLDKAQSNTMNAAASRCGMTPGPVSDRAENFSPGAPRYNVTGWSIKSLRWPDHASIHHASAILVSRHKLNDNPPHMTEIQRGLGWKKLYTFLYFSTIFVW